MLRICRSLFQSSIPCKRFSSSLVLIEHNGTHAEKLNYNVISAASKFGKVTCLVAGFQCEKVANEIAEINGVSDVLLADNMIYKNYLAESYVPLVLKTHSKLNCSHILAPCSTFGKSILPRVACKLNVSPVSDIIKIIDENTFQRPIYAGNAIVTLQSLDAIKCLTIRPSSFPPSSKSNAVAIHEAPLVASNDFGTEVNGLSEHVSLECLKSERPDLGAADIVVSGGRGLKNADNFKLIYDLADRLKAAVGASRAAVDGGFAPSDMQVGQTGKIVAPKLYIAIGISGAIQHLAGMKDSKFIVAINKDADAPIFQVADFGLVEDLFKAVPTFIKLLEK